MSTYPAAGTVLNACLLSSSFNPHDSTTKYYYYCHFQKRKLSLRGVTQLAQSCTTFVTMTPWSGGRECVMMVRQLWLQKLTLAGGRWETMCTRGLHKDAHAPTRTHTCTHSKKCTHTHIYTCTHSTQMNAYMHAHMCTHAHMHVHTRAHMHTHVCTHMRAHTRAHTHILASAHTCTHSHAHTHTYAHVHTYACAHAGTQVQAHTCTLVCTHMRVHTHACIHTGAHTYTCTHTHTHACMHARTHMHTYSPCHPDKSVVEVGVRWTGVKLSSSNLLCDLGPFNSLEAQCPHPQTEARSPHHAPVVPLGQANI